MRVNYKSNKSKGYFSGLLSGITWGLDAVLLGIVLIILTQTKNPKLILGSVFLCSLFHDLFAAIWMIIISLIKRDLGKFKRAFRSKDVLFCILGALFGGPLAMSFYMLAIDKGGPAVTATVTAGYPLLGSALAVVFLKEKMSVISWLGLFICVLGIVFIGFNPSESDNSDIFLGIFFAVIAAIGWATEAVVCGYGMKSGSITPSTALLIRELTSAVAYLFIVTPFILGGFSEMFLCVGLFFKCYSAWLLLLATSFIGMFSFLMWYTSIDLIGASKALCLNVTYSFWAVFFSVILQGESISLSTILGSILVITGVVVSTLFNKKNT